jgi:hypothetical protein
MPPSEAKQLTPAEAIILLQDDDDTRRQCAAQNRATGSMPTPEDQRAALAEHKRQLRLQYTGSEEL